MVYDIFNLLPPSGQIYMNETVITNDTTLQKGCVIDEAYVEQFSSIVLLLIVDSVEQ